MWRRDVDHWVDLVAWQHAESLLWRIGWTLAFLAIGDYAQEFVPGPMSGGTFQPDIPRFRSYELLRGADGNVDTTTADYAQWPALDGAPLDSAGKPLLIGDKTIWSYLAVLDATAFSLNLFWKWPVLPAAEALAEQIEW